MNPLIYFTDAVTRRELVQCRASRRKWRTLARLLAARLRIVSAQLTIAHDQIKQQNRIVQSNALELEQLRRRVTELGGGDA